MTRIGILSNVHSKRNQSALPAIERMLAEFPEAAHQSFHHIKEMPQAVATLARGGVDHLVINGGDGTAQAVLGELLERSPFSAAAAHHPDRRRHDQRHRARCRDAERADRRHCAGF